MLASISGVSAHDWSGFYFGARAGYGSTDFDGHETIVDFFGDEFQDITGPGVISLDEFFSLAETSDCGCALIDTEGFVNGLQAGYNWQNGRFVFGIEAAATRVSFDASEASLGGFLGETTSTGEIADGIMLEDTFFAIGTVTTFRYRAGMAYDRLLVFGSAGLAVAKATAYVNAIAAVGMDPSGDQGTSFLNEFYSRERVFGVTLGLGAEYALTDKISLSFDYQHIELGGLDLEGETLPNFDLETRELHVGLDLVQAGVNFRF